MIDRLKSPLAFAYYLWSLNILLNGKRTYGNEGINYSLDDMRRNACGDYWSVNITDHLYSLDTRKVDSMLGLTWIY